MGYPSQTPALRTGMNERKTTITCSGGILGAFFSPYDPPQN